MYESVYSDPVTAQTANRDAEDSVLLSQSSQWSGLIPELFIVGCQLFYVALPLVPFIFHYIYAHFMNLFRLIFLFFGFVLMLSRS